MLLHATVCIIYAVMDIAIHALPTFSGLYIICWHSFTSDSTQTALLSSSFSYKVITSLKFGESRKQSIYSSGGSPIFVRLHMTAQAKQQACMQVQGQGGGQIIENRKEM